MRYVVGVINLEKIMKQVTIFHSNDIHSRLEQCAKVATIIQAGRQQYDDQVIAVDIGDHMDRARMETEGTDGYLHREILNATSYDLITLGNNEGLTFSIEQLDKVYRGDNTFKVVCSNIQAAQGEQPSWLLPYYILNKNGIRIGFVAATANFTAFYSQMGWLTEEPIEAIQIQIEKLRGQVDVIVLLSHLGIRLDEEIADRQIGIDIILGAHTHHLFDPPVQVKDTLLCAAGKFGDYVGKVHISMDGITGKLQVNGECIPTAAYELDQNIMKLINQYSVIAKQTMRRHVVDLITPLQARDDRESSLPNLLAIGLRNWCDAEIGLVNNGQLLAGLAKGEVTAGEIHGICPSPINPCRLELLGKDILEALEQSLLYSYIHMPIKGFGFRGEQLGTIAVDGMTIEYSPERPDLNKILNVQINGKPLLDERLYSVATIDMFTFNIGYSSLSRYANVQYFLPEFIRHILEIELKNAHSITLSEQRNWISK